MGRYSTATSIYRMLKGVPSTTANTQLIQQVADRASGIIDGYVGRWYSVAGWTSSSSTPQIIQSISDRLVAQQTMRYLFTKDGQNKNEWVEELGAQAREDLQAIMKQDLIVLDSTGTEATRASTAPLIEGTREQYTPVFDLDDESAWTVDSDLTDDISSDRG